MKHLAIELNNLIENKKYDVTVSEGNGSIDLNEWDGVADASGSQQILLSGTGLNKVTTEMIASQLASLLHTLDNPNAFGTAENDNFGRSLAISTNYCISGTHYEDDAGGLASGKAYIFDNATGNLLHTLDNPNAYDTSSDDWFGYCVAIDDTKCIVGAIYEDSIDGNSSGKAYIFDNATGNLLHTIDNINSYGTHTNDNMGSSVSIHGNYCAIGAKSQESSTASNSGICHIFNTNTGALLHTIENPNAYGSSGGDNFGSVVVIDDIHCVVSAINEDDDNDGGAYGDASGKVYIFNLLTGALLHTLDNPNAYGTSIGDKFGEAIAISSSYCLIGARLEDSVAGISSGKVYLYNINTGSLLHTFDDPNIYGDTLDYFGYAVAIQGNYCFIGAYTEDEAGGEFSGVVYIYKLDTHELIQTITNPNVYGTPTQDFFGYRVATCDGYLTISAHGEGADDNEEGKVYIYELS